MSAQKTLGKVSSERGSALVEFGVTCFLLIMLMLGIVEVYRMVLVYTSIENATRIGARYATVHGADNHPHPSVCHVVKQYASIGTANPSNLQCQSSGCTHPGCHVMIKVTYPYDSFVGYFPFSGLTFSSTSEGVITF